jgi:PAS domain S-box-containing protein
MAFSSRKKQLGAIYQVVLWSLSGLFLSMVLTNDLHHLHWVAYSVNTQTHATNYEYGPLFWLFFVFTYVLLFAGNISLIQLYFRLTTFYRSQITLTLIAAVLPLLGNLIYVFHVNPIPGFDWTPFLFLISDFLMAINILRFKAFDLVPFARNKLIDIMPDGIMITDSSGRIIDLNPALVAFSGKTESEMIGKKIEEVFPARQNFIDEMKEKHDRFDCSFSENTEGVDSFFDFSVTPLHSNTGTVDGHLIQVKEVTRRVEAERQIQDANRHLMAEIQEKEKLIADLNAFSHMVATI